MDVELQDPNHSVVYGLGVGGIRCFDPALGLNCRYSLPEEYYLDHTKGGILAYLGDRGARSPRMDDNVLKLFDAVVVARDQFHEKA